MVDKPTWFEIDTTNIGNSLAEIILVNSCGWQDVIPVLVKKIGPGRFRCEYASHESSLHSINITSSSDAKEYRAYGRCIQPKGVRTRDAAKFRVITKDAMKAIVAGPNCSEIPCRITKANNRTYEYGYVLNRIGPHTVNITYGGAHIPKSLFPVAVGPYKDSHIRAYDL